MADNLPPFPSRADLIAASPDEIAEALSYALRYDDRGRPRRGGGDVMAGITADRMVEHLRRAGFIVMRTRPARPHSAG